MLSQCLRKAIKLVKTWVVYFKFFCFIRLTYISGATTIEKYDLRTNSWTQVANMSGRRLQFGVAVIEDKLYIVGGRDGLKTLNTVECFDPKKKSWNLMPPMSTHRHGLGVGVLEGPMYAVGGHDGWSYLNTVERWDPQARQWSFVAPMSTSRSTVGVAVLMGKYVHKSFQIQLNMITAPQQICLYM